MTSNRSEAWYRSRSLWLDEVDLGAPRITLSGDVHVDVAIIGGGFTGLWTAYYLAVARPGLRIAVLEREIVGYGAAGRNGGWVGAGIAGSSAVYAAKAGWQRTRLASHLTEQAVDEIGAVADAEEIPCDYLKRGTLTIARTTPQWQRLQAEVDHAKTTGMLAPGVELLSPEQVRDYVAVPEVVGGAFTPHCARVQPAQLARGLAAACERRGVSVYEHTEATSVHSNTVVTAGGVVRASSVLVATEAWTSRFAGQRRRYMPLTSMMVATAPLTAEQWKALGWPPGLTIRDRRHLFFYAQRTSDDRIAIGGRGAPYALRDPLGEFDSAQSDNTAIWDRLIRTLHEHFPGTEQHTVTHRWGGTLAVPRDWSMGVRYDHSTGLGWAGGYSGHGVVASYLAGRSLCDLVLGVNSPHADAPWVGHKSRRWEPEPLRFLAANGIVRVLDSADRREDSTNRAAWRAKLVKPFMPPA
ncbi:NAD(P)/FAD-dependent oxidoreductase [Catenulispora rubra]|uniref:NAD(P)/FAD-dependent oxidoreductase n=1 Tax=Catenulispora rubra TaxID=280293 RepID=UPI0018928452|nr:FAD-dependent oxidoreductase [Catenulispora rubra]